jgi:predicted TIM-barrel fold metal-dependent hydrolase
MNARKVVGFVHPYNNGPESTTFNERVILPASDWPHETGRTAMGIIVNQRMQHFPDVKIILLHAVGTLPTLVQRATMMVMPEFVGVMSAEEIYKGAPACYLDTALAGSPGAFPLITTFAKKVHLLFGSDYSRGYASQSKAHSDPMEPCQLDDEKRK